jgi:hypothetical protein
MVSQPILGDKTPPRGASQSRAYGAGVVVGPYRQRLGAETKRPNQRPKRRSRNDDGRWLYAQAPRTQYLPRPSSRERVVIDPPTACACRGGKLGEDVTRTLEPAPRKWKVIETVRGEVVVYAHTSDMAGVTCRAVKETREG